MARIKLTKTAVDAVSASLQPHQDHVVWDSEVKGLGLRFRGPESRHWLFRYRYRGRQRFLAIGEYYQPWSVETARTRAKILQGDVAAGKDPAAQRDRQRAVPVLEVMAERWIREHAEPHKSPSSAHEDKALLARLGVAFVDRPRGKVGDLGRSRVDAITREQVAALHRKLKPTPTGANRALTLLSAIFSWAGRMGDSNPCRGIRRYRENRRERYLSPDEYLRLGKTLDEVEDLGIESPVTVGAIRLLLLTGARLGELLGAKRADVDLAAATLRVEQPKERRPKLIRLAPEAMLVIEALPRYKDNPWLLPGRRTGAHLINLEDVWSRVRKRAGLEDVHLHDLRHSYASVVAAGGASLPIIGGLLGHRNPSTTARYAHLGEDPLRGVANAAAARISEALKGKKEMQ